MGIIKLVVIGVVVLIVLFFVGSKLTGMFIGNTTSDSCTDTDGRNYGVRGFVFGEIRDFFSKQYFHEEDKCLSEIILLEFYCVKDEKGISSYEGSEEYDCKEGCFDGACIGEIAVVEEGGEIESPEQCGIWCKIKKVFNIFS